MNEEVKEHKQSVVVFFFLQFFTSIVPYRRGAVFSDISSMSKEKALSQTRLRKCNFPSCKKMFCPMEAERQL